MVGKGGDFMFLEFKDTRWNSKLNSGIEPARICYGCENICLFACTSCDGCQGSCSKYSKG